jgi:uncharacterized membrane protein YqjE
MLSNALVSLIQILGWLLATLLMTVMPIVIKLLSLMTVFALVRWATTDTPFYWVLVMLGALAIAKSYPAVARKLFSLYRKDNLTQKNV